MYNQHHNYRNSLPPTGWWAFVAVIGLLQSLQEEQGLTVIVATHDSLVMDMVHTCVHLRDGRIEREPSN